MNGDLHVVATKYARALFFLAREKQQIEEVSRDLELVAAVFGSGEGQQILLDPRVSRERKLEAVQALVARKVTPLTQALLKLLVEKRRGNLVGHIARSFGEEIRAWQGQKIATVTSAIPLTADQLKKMKAMLAEWTGANVDLEQIHDPDLRGGARIRLGDLVLDGTVEARLAQLRKKLTREDLN